MPFSEDLEGVPCDVHGFGDVRIGQGGVDEVVVVIREEYAAADTFRDPFLMEHQRRIVRQAEIEERRRTADAERESEIGGGFRKFAAEFRTFFHQNTRTVELFQLFDARDPGGKRNRRHPVTAGVRQ